MNQQVSSLKKYKKMDTITELPRSDYKLPEIKSLPPLNFSHIVSLTDDTGIIQHAIFSIPNRKEGYCIDDNARALMLMVFACKDKKNESAFRLLPIYISFVHYMQTGTGEFKNFMGYDKSCFEEKGSEDSFGRTVMALGYLVNEGVSSALVKVGMDMFQKAYHNIDKLVSIRGMANSLVGVCQFIKYNYPDDIKTHLVIKLADKMVAMYHENSSEHWKWFEPVLTYDNAILPLALLNAYEVTNDENYLTIAFESMQFLESKVFHKNIFRPVGNDGWLSEGGIPAQFDQQGIDAMAMVLFYSQAFRITRDYINVNKMNKCYQWFLGKNDLKVSLYDPHTGGCADGLHSEGINLNQGAESTLAYLISNVVMVAALKE
jgi:hypothetical protein